MRRHKYLGIAVVLFLFVGLQVTVFGQASDDSKLAIASGGGSIIRWDVVAQNAGGTLTITTPDNRSFRRSFRAGGSPEISLSDKQLEALPDGVYSYELRLNPVLTPGQKEALLKARGNDDDPEAERAGRRRPVVPAMVQSGAFSILNGSIVLGGAVENQRAGKAVAPRSRTPMSANTVSRLFNHRVALGAMPDVVTADDEIIQGSLCVGLDCVNNESFGFDTIRLKENNTRISFNDTSTSAGFPTNDWTIRANASGSGGGNFLAFVDRGTTENGDESGTIVFEVDAGASANALRVASNSKVGLRTATPVLDVHITTTDTPAIRQEQTNGGGFTAQTWDIGANEANWFVRDVTGGSRLPFRIRPGAPTSSIDISATGNVGVGTASPTVNLDVRGSNSKIQVGTETAGFLGGTQTGLGISNGTEKFLAVVQTGGGFFGTISNSPLGLVANNNTRVTISGAGAVQFNTYGAGTLTTDASGNITASSDERLKKNIRPYTRGLHNVLGLRPILYGYTPESGLDQTRDNYAGFSAQNVKEYVPEAVGVDSRGMLTLSDRPIIVALVNSIKEQQKQIDELKGQIRKLRAASQRHRR